MATLADLAKLVRSKNAGPFWLTIDIMFDDPQAYRRARDAEIVNRAAIARLYNRDPAEIIVVNHDTELSPSPKLRLQARQRRLRAKLPRYAREWVCAGSASSCALAGDNGGCLASDCTPQHPQNSSHARPPKVSPAMSASSAHSCT
jgi:hypothetical protein